MEPFTPAVVAQRCTVDPGLVEDAIGLLLAAGRLAIQTGTGVSMGAAPNIGEWLAWALGAATGSLGRPAVSSSIPAPSGRRRSGW